MSKASTQIELPLPGSSSGGSAPVEALQIPPTSLIPLSASTGVLPPFRSATEFPRAPKRDQLAALYAACLQSLQEANAARQIHRRRLESRKQVIAAIRLEIARLEQDLALEAGTRAKLHAMNLRLFAALKEMDVLVDGLDTVVLEAHRVSRSALGRQIDRLKAQIQKWRSLKQRLRQELFSLKGSHQDGGRP